MRRLIPDTIAGRTFLLLVLSLAVSHALSVVFYATDRASSLDLLGSEHIAERMVTLTRLIENASPHVRTDLASLASSGTMSVSLTNASRVQSRKDLSPQEQTLVRIFEEHMVRIGRHSFLLRYTEATPEAAGSATSDLSAPPTEGSRHLAVSIQLSDGSWINFATAIEELDSVWSLRFGLSMGVMIVLVVLISAILVRYLNRPLGLLSSAARRLGHDVAAPPLPVSGPREVREAIGAFNDMQAQVQRLVEDRTQMLTAISHDLRTPITLLRLRAEFVSDEAERARMLATLDDMESMIRGVLAFARDDATKEPPQIVDLGALVASICHDMADAGLPVEFEQGPKLTHNCRRSSMARAITNLIDNAVKYGRRARVLLEPKGEAIRIVIDDDGPGIPADQMEKAFRPFVRLDRSRGGEKRGTGLGLSIARSMVLANGGKLTLENRDEGGLRATVWLPR